MTAEGERTFGWYRGPLTPVPPSTVPGLHLPDGTPGYGSDSTSSDDLLVYLPEWGVFDLSYAAAWTMGRLVALSHAPAGSAVSRLQHQARATALRVLSRLTTPPEISGLDAAAQCSVEELAGHRPALRRFHRLMEEGLPQRLTRIPAADAARSAAAVRTAPPQAERLHTLLDRDDVRAVLAEALAEQAEPVADIVEALYTLKLVSFDHLVADPRMLPLESVRFFHVDPTWIAALVTGLASTGVSTTLDLALQKALSAAVTAHLDSRQPPPQAGLLLRSRLALDWPGLIIEAARGNTPAMIVRRDYLAPDLLLCLFDQVPDTVALSEPHQDLYLGVAGEDYALELRSLRGANPGAPLVPEIKFPLSFRQDKPPNVDRPEVVDVASVLPGLSEKLRVQGQLDQDEQVTPAGFAVELIQSPHRQVFRLFRH